MGRKVKVKPSCVVSGALSVPYLSPLNEITEQEMEEGSFDPVDWYLNLTFDDREDLGYSSQLLRVLRQPFEKHSTDRLHSRFTMVIKNDYISQSKIRFNLWRAVDKETNTANSQFLPVNHRIVEDRLAGCIINDIELHFQYATDSKANLNYLAAQNTIPQENGTGFVVLLVLSVLISFVLYLLNKAVDQAKGLNMGSNSLVTMNRYEEQDPMAELLEKINQLLEQQKAYLGSTEKLVSTSYVYSSDKASTEFHRKQLYAAFNAGSQRYPSTRTYLTHDEMVRTHIGGQAKARRRLQGQESRHYLSAEHSNPLPKLQILKQGQKKRSIKQKSVRCREALHIPRKRAKCPDIRVPRKHSHQTSLLMSKRRRTTVSRKGVASSDPNLFSSNIYDS